MAMAGKRRAARVTVAEGIPTWYACVGGWRVVIVMYPGMTEAWRLLTVGQLNPASLPYSNCFHRPSSLPPSHSLVLQLCNDDRHQTTHPYR